MTMYNVKKRIFSDATILSVWRKLLMVVVVCAVPFFCGAVAASEARTTEIRNAYVLLAAVSNDGVGGVVNFSVVDPPADACGGEYQFKFYLSNVVSNNEVNTVYGNEYLSLLVLAKLNHMPIRIKYLTDASPVAPIRKDYCGSNERNYSVVTSLGIDKDFE